MKRRCESGASKRKRQKEREQYAESQRNSMHKFLIPNLSRNEDLNKNKPGGTDQSAECASGETKQGLEEAEHESEETDKPFESECEPEETNQRLEATCEPKRTD